MIHTFITILICTNILRCSYIFPECSDFDSLPKINIYNLLFVNKFNPILTVKEIIYCSLQTNFKVPKKKC